MKLSYVTRVALAAALLTGAGSTAATAQPDPPGGGPCYVWWEPWMSSTIDGVPDVNKPHFSCLY
jgi:hypothetical protein